MVEKLQFIFIYKSNISTESYKQGMFSVSPHINVQGREPLKNRNAQDR